MLRYPRRDILDPQQRPGVIGLVSTIVTSVALRSSGSASLTALFLATRTLRKSSQPVAGFRYYQQRASHLHHEVAPIDLQKRSCQPAAGAFPYHDDTAGSGLSNDEARREVFRATPFHFKGARFCIAARNSLSIQPCEREELSKRWPAAGHLGILLPFSAMKALRDHHPASRV
jgi:hypothetical protein